MARKISRFIQKKAWVNQEKKKQEIHIHTVVEASTTNIQIIHITQTQKEYWNTGVLGQHERSQYSIPQYSNTTQREQCLQLAKQ